MIGVFFSVKFIVTGISSDFGTGFVVGGFSIAFLLWIAERIDKKSAASSDRDF
jgi:hypothetical protein